jgi:hypothetical protein
MLARITVTERIDRCQAQRCRLAAVGFAGAGAPAGSPPFGSRALGMPTSSARLGDAPRF